MFCSSLYIINLSSLQILCTLIMKICDSQREIKISLLVGIYSFANFQFTNFLFCNFNPSLIFIYTYKYTYICRQVLNSILNPNLPIGEGLFDPEQENRYQETDQVPENVLNLERLGRFAAEKGEIQESLAFFHKVINSH